MKEDHHRLERGQSWDQGRW